MGRQKTRKETMRDNQNTTHHARVRSDAIVARAAVACLLDHRFDKNRHSNRRWSEAQRRAEREDREDSCWN